MGIKDNTQINLDEKNYEGFQTMGIALMIHFDANNILEILRIFTDYANSLT